LASRGMTMKLPYATPFALWTVLMALSGSFG
jgi:hypothetical protein